MAKKNGLNKTQAVKEYFRANPKAKNQEVVDAMAKQGITISANYVGNIKATHNKRGERGRASSPREALAYPRSKRPCVSSRQQGAWRRQNRPLPWPRRSERSCRRVAEKL